MSQAQVDLKPQRLTEQTFAPFGEVLEMSVARGMGLQVSAINGGTSLKFANLAHIQLSGSDGSISIFRAQPRTLPMELELLERHPLGSQAFLPMKRTRFAVVVAGSKPSPSPQDVQLFLAEPDQGINIRSGVWHHPLLALAEVSDFLVVDRRDQEHNLEELDVRDWGLLLPASVLPS